MGDVEPPDSEQQVPATTDHVSPAPAADFEAWVAARGAALQCFAYLVTGSASEAPDLVQEALINAYPRWATLAREDTAEAYVRRSIVNGSVSRWRKSRRQVPVSDVATMSRGHVDDPAAAHADADHAWRLCRDLPPNQRAAVVLRFYEDLSFAQIALILNCTESTARSHVHRAVAALRARLTESETSHD
jgi:RNA polymerase sigma-70 factor (sigma-E family)